MAVKTLSGAGVLYTDRRQFYLKPNVVQELWSDVTPFTTMVSNRSMVSGLQDPLFKLFEHRDPWVKQQFVIASPSSATIANDDTGITLTASGTPVGLPAVTDAAYITHEFEIWDTTKTTRRGVVLVTANSAGTLTVKNLSTTAITGVIAGDIAMAIGTGAGEGSLAPKAWADELKVVYGSTQMFETAIEITGILYQAALRGYSKELERLRMQKNKEHKMQLERTLLFGNSVLGTGLADSRDGSSTESFGDTAGTNHRTDANGNSVRTTMGLVTAIEKYGVSDPTNDDQNIFNIVSGSYSFSNFVDDMEKVFHYYPDGGVKYAFSAPGAMSYWSKLDGNKYITGKSGWRIDVGETQRDTLGFNIRMLETPHGQLALIPTPALRGPYNNRMVVVSDNNLSLVQYQPSQFNVNIKTDDGYKGEKDVYFDDCGLGMTLIESHKEFIIQ